MGNRRNLNLDLAWAFIAFGFAGLAFAAGIVIWSVSIGHVSRSWFYWVILNGFVGCRCSPGWICDNSSARPQCRRLQQ